MVISLLLTLPLINIRWTWHLVITGFHFSAKTIFWLQQNLLISLRVLGELLSTGKLVQTFSSDSFSYVVSRPLCI